ncbi:MAG: hypothetical protein M3033_15300 [Acidobacteriota bacterium]|nr:hypothetical protein [Acidobacteriota bacterium]
MNDTPAEIEKMLDEIWSKRSPQERAQIASAMFVSARKVILATMPENLSEAEQKRYIYERTYGEPLPHDFFSNRKK